MSKALSIISRHGKYFAYLAFGGSAAFLGAHLIDKDNRKKHGERNYELFAKYVPLLTPQNKSLVKFSLPDSIFKWDFWNKEPVSTPKHDSMMNGTKNLRRIVYGNGDVYE